MKTCLAVLLSISTLQARPVCSSSHGNVCEDVATVQRAAIGRMYGAIVGGTQVYDNGDSYSTAAAGLGLTREEAVAEALYRCRAPNGNVVVKCSVIKVFEKGCWYVTTGKPRSGSGTQVFHDISKEGLLGQCRQAGYRCEVPRGECLNDTSDMFNDESD